MTILSITDQLVEMMRYLQDKKLIILSHNVEGFTVTLQRFEALQWSVGCNMLKTSDMYDVAEFIHARQK